MNKQNPQRGDVWIMNPNPVQGHEKANKRPCIVLSSNIFNEGVSELIIAIPLTRTDRKNPLHIKISPPEGGLAFISYALCDQIRSLSHLQLDRYMGKVNYNTIISIEFMLKTLLDFDSQKNVVTFKRNTITEIAS